MMYAIYGIDCFTLKANGSEELRDLDTNLYFLLLSHGLC